MKFRFLEHTADIKFQAFGKTLNELFKNSGLALKEIMSEDKVKVKIKKQIGVHSEQDLEGALYNFLEEFLVLFDSENFLVSKILKMKVEEKSGTYFISCEIWGDDAKNYEISNHVKAVTYNEMFVKKRGDKFISQVVVDI